MAKEQEHGQDEDVHERPEERITGPAHPVPIGESEPLLPVFKREYVEELESEIAELRQALAQERNRNKATQRLQQQEESERQILTYERDQLQGLLRQRGAELANLHQRAAIAEDTVAYLRSTLHARDEEFYNKLSRTLDRLTAEVRSSEITRLGTVADMLTFALPPGQLHGADSGSLEKAMPADSSTIRLRIMEEPLTASNLVLILSALTSLHTKCWLIATKRSADLIEYTQTHDARFDAEANLVVEKVAHNSPADIKLNVNADASPQAIVAALGLGIDAITQAGIRHKEAKLKAEALALETKIKEQDAQAILAEKEQTLQIEAQKAELDKRERLLEIEAKLLDLQERRLEIEKKRIDYALETAGKMIDILRPGADQETKEILLRTLLPDLLSLGNGKGLELKLLSTTQDVSQTDP